MLTFFLIRFCPIPLSQHSSSCLKKLYKFSNRESYAGRGCLANGLYLAFGSRFPFTHSDIWAQMYEFENQHLKSRFVCDCICDGGL